MADEFKGLNKETSEVAVSIKNSMREIGISTQALDKQLQKTKGYLIDINDEYQGIRQSSGQVAKLQQEAQKSNKATEKAIVEQNKQLNISKTLNIQIDNLYTAALNATGKTQENLLKQAKNLTAARDNADKLANSFESIAEDSSKLDKSTMWFGALSNIVKDIPGLRAFAKPFEEASEAARKQVITNAKIKAGATDLGKTQSSTMAGLIAGFESLGPIISSAFAPLAILVSLKKVFDFFKDAMFAADERVTNIAKNLSISKKDAGDIYSNLANLKGVLDTSLGTTKNIVEAFNDLTELSDFIVIGTQSQIDAQITLTKEIGISKDAALGFQEALVVSNVSAKQGVDIVYDQIAAFANQNKIVADGRKIFDQIAKTSKLIQLNFNGNFSSLVKTTLQANKLGLSLDQVSKVGESLLNFEQSISSELEAELLTGRNLNLEKARLFALNHDIAGLTQEIANQGITATNFAAMNVIQQEAIAKSLGMSANELGESLFNQEKINKAAGNYTKELRNQGKLKLAQSIEQGILEGQTLEEAQRSITAQEKFNFALEKAKEIFSDLVTGGALDTLADTIQGIANSINSFKWIMTFSRGYSGSVERQVMEATTQARIEANNQRELKTKNTQSTTANPGSTTNSTGFANGGEVPSGYPNDTFPARLSSGETVVPFKMSEFLNEFKEIKNLLSQQNTKQLAVYLDSTKVNTATGLTAYRG